MQLLAVSALVISIIGGADDPGDDAVVSLQIGGFPSCTGTIIAPRTVLTAGHCLAAYDVGLSITVVAGADATDPAKAQATFDVVDHVQHPQYSGEGKDFDCGMLKLDRDAAITPIGLSDHKLVDADVGRDLRHVGYGVSNEADGTGRGVRRSVDMAITKVTSTLVFSGSSTQQTCDGDSGGPGFVIDDDGVERVSSITSDGPSCHEVGWDTTVQSVRTFIDDTRARFENPTPSNNAPSGCTCAHGASSRSDFVALALLAFTLRRLPRVRPRELTRRYGRVHR